MTHARPANLPSDDDTSATKPAGIHWASLGREFVVTFLGLLLALAVNSWWQERQDRKAELETLAEIRTDLRTDSADVQGNLSRLHVAAASVRSLGAQLDQHRAYTPAVDSMLMVLGWWIDHERNAAGYAMLKSRGIRLITNDSLRRAIAHYYETTYGEEDQHDRVAAAASDRAQPVFHHYARQATFFAPAHPVNYTALAADQDFRAFLDNTADQLSGSVPFEETLAGEITALSARIDRELAKRR